MSTLQNRITALVQLGNDLKSDAAWVQQAKIQSKRANAWFEIPFIDMALKGIAEQFLDEVKLIAWSADIEPKSFSKTVGIICAGNIPMVAFHDFIAVFLSGCKVQLKLSEKDQALFMAVYSRLAEIDPYFTTQVSIVPRLKDFDAVIATGSNNTNRYFEHYFKNVPSILRGSRTSVAVLSGQESEADLLALSDDIFAYFGFGCRNVSKLMVPVDYEIEKLFPVFETKYKWLTDNSKYNSNYEYQRTILLLNKIEHLANEFVMLKKEPALVAPIATVHYDYYADVKSVQTYLKTESDAIQCVVSGVEFDDISTVQFGESQQPSLFDYADNVDVLAFLNQLK